MKKKIRIAYEVLFVFLAIFMLITVTQVKTRITDYRGYDGDYILSHYTHEWVEVPDAPCGGKDVVEFAINDHQCMEGDILFYAVHQEVNIYIQDKIVYSARRDANNLYGKTPGNFWVVSRLNSQDLGKSIRIEFTPAYKNVMGEIPQIYIGNARTIIIDKFKKSIFTALIAFITFVIGAGFMIWILYNKADTYMDRSLYYLACFAMYIGLWKLFDLDVMSFLVDNSIALAFVPLICLSMVVAPFTLFLQELFVVKKEFVYNALCIVCLVYAYVVLILQVLNIRDYRECLLVNHILMGVLIIVGVRGGVLEVLKNGWTQKIKINSLCLLGCFLGTIIDLILYYLASDETVSCFGILGFLTYIVIIGFANIRENRRLSEEGKKAEKYQDMAFHDQLTGLYSRSAFSDYTNPVEFDPNGTIMIMCDLNNLKKCNDTFGHEAGDRYLVESSRLIKEVFESRGRCFRMGGDEFAVILKDTSLKICAEYINELIRKQHDYRQEHPTEFPICIACGYTVFDRAFDNDFNDTMRRADKLMYADKIRIKKLMNNDSER